MRTLCDRSGLGRMVAVGLIGLATGLAGCVGYGSTRGIDSETVFDNPNSPSLYDVAGTSVRWVALRYPPHDDWGQGPENWPANAAQEETGGPWGTGEPRYAVNLPVGMRRGAYLEVVRRAGSGAAPVTFETNHLPIYHVTRVRVRGDEATVDVLRPVLAFGTSPEGIPVYQGITVHLRGGFKPWNVVAHKVWTVGALPTPEIYYLPAEGEKSGPADAAIEPFEEIEEVEGEPMDEPLPDLDGQ